LKSNAHFGVLDGWRGISITLVLAAHLLPLGPKVLKLNHAAGVLGMVLFFVLSGFLITSLLLKGSSLTEFAVRRAFRILPLVWSYIALAMIVSGVTWDVWSAHLFFYANLPPKALIPMTDHLWSVCVEMQFYAGVALLVAALGTRGLYLLPIACVAFTLLRVANGVHTSSVTWFRFDEILAGCILALAYHCRRGEVVRRFAAATPQWVLLLLLVVSSMHQSGWFNYLRPYLGAALIGATLVNPDTRMGRLLNTRTLAYLAGISYALYVLHPMLAHSWLGSGDIFEKYAKRPFLFIVLFSLAHLSTYYFEKRWIEAGKVIAARMRGFSRGRRHA
jgi:peptidoglycan/LPS O-acetylase OafA/YrhL